MMRKSVLIVLFLATLLVVDTEANWFKNTINKIKNAIKTAIDKVKEFVKKHKPVIVDTVERIIGRIGKRSVPNPCSPEQEANMKKMAEDLTQSCPTFGIDPNEGLTAEAVQYAFVVSDEDDNAALDATELGMFEMIMDTYEQCVVMEKAKRK